MKAQRGEDDVFWEPAETATVEIKIKRSLFVGRLGLCRSAEEVRSILDGAESDYRDATHHCWAYRLGPDPQVEHSSDGGEPAGTAGKPILSAIRQSGMHNVMVVVTRYFGGIKLGVRGLIEAYGQTAAGVVGKVVRVSRVRSRRVVIRLPYAVIGDIAHFLEVHGVAGAPSWSYDSQVEVAADVRWSVVPQITMMLDEFQARKRIHSWNWVLLK
ncbi:MAG: YigZ family protein [Synergistaceae bacterium]|nr:YigZ family protein [Synergistaceae bacterium]